MCYEAARMDESQRGAFQAIAEEAEHLGDEVEAALDELAAFSYALETRRKVEDVSSRYRALVNELVDEKDRLLAERSFGRRVVDLQKMATRLPRALAGQPAE